MWKAFLCCMCVGFKTSWKLKCSIKLDRLKLIFWTSVIWLIKCYYVTHIWMLRQEFEMYSKNFLIPKTLILISLKMILCVDMIFSFQMNSQYYFASAWVVKVIFITTFQQNLALEKSYRMNSTRIETIRRKINFLKSVVWRHSLDVFSKK